MNFHVITATCEGCGGKQELKVHGQTSERAELLAGIMDGTSPVYVVPVPRDGSSMIGKCGLCPTGVFRCKVTEEST